MKHLQRFVGSAIAASLLAACSGTAGGLDGSVIPSAGAQRSAAPKSRDGYDAKARVEIRIPRRHKHRAHFVSPNTTSMKIVANGKSLGTYNLTPSGKGCSAIDGATQCVFTIGVPVGKVTFAISLFDSNKNLLSTGSVTKKIVAGTLAVIPLTLEGVINAITVTVGNANTNAGIAAALPVYVTSYDASGAAIIGPGNYTTPITLTDSDASGITSLSTTTVNGPGAKVTLSYTGKSIFSATIGASASGVSASNVTSGTFAPTPVVFASYNPPNTIPTSADAIAIAAGSDGNVWYTTHGGSAGQDAIVQMTTAGTVLNAYVAGTTPNLTANGYFQGIVAGPDGNMWFTDQSNNTIGRITPTGTVTEVSAGSLCPNRIVKGPASDGGLWFTSQCNAFIGHVTVGATPTVTTYALSGGGTHFWGILLGKDGNLYVADQTNNAIGQVQIAGGAVTGYSELPIPDASFGPNANLLGIAQTADGQLWFTNDADAPSTLGSITIGSPFTTSAVHEFTTKQGGTWPAYVTTSPDGSTIFEAIWDYPVIEIAKPTGIGTAPNLTDVAFQTFTANSVYQETWDVAIGPDGNVWSTINDSGGNDSGNVVVMAY